MTSRRKSIVLITVDCLRADHVGFMRYHRSTTPFLDSLAQESFVVPTAIVGGAPTYYSLPAILASRYPLSLGRDVMGIGPNESTLASTLREAGYATACFSAGNPYISARFGYNRGFDTFRDFLTDAPQPPEETKGYASQSRASRVNRKLQELRPAMGPLGSVYDELYFRYCQRVTPVAGSLDALRRFPAADEIVDHACVWLTDTGDSPFFLWLHLMDPHSPYYPKEEALALMGEEPLTPSRARYLNSYWNRSDLGVGRLAGAMGEIVSLYDAGIRWADTQMERLVSALRGSNRWDDCIFAVSADHGEEFLEHGGRYHAPTRLAEELIHVPLLLRVPGSGKKDVSTSPFSHIHLAPTLLDAAEAEISGGFEGESRWPQIRDGGKFDGAAISECIQGCTNPFRQEARMGSRVLSVREERFKLVLFFDPPAEHLYDLESDPGEKSPLEPAAGKPVRRRLLEIAREHLRKSVDGRGSRPRVQLRVHDLQLEWDKSAGEASPLAS
jgi:arylsulfatase A-like enzyme